MEKFSTACSIILLLVPLSKIEVVVAVICCFIIFLFLEKNEK